MSTAGEDEVLSALSAVESAIEANLEAGRAIRRRARQLRAARARGRSWGEIVDAEQPPRVVELLRATQDRLAVAGSAFRRAEAAALRREGYTLDEIARLFGVTRPRIVALLRVGPAAGIDGVSGEDGAEAPSPARPGGPGRGSRGRNGRGRPPG